MCCCLGGVAEVIKEMRRKQEEDGREEPAATEGCPEIDTKDTEKKQNTNVLAIS